MKFDTATSAIAEPAPNGWSWSHTADPSATVLFVGIVHHFDGHDVTAVTYGGQAMTEANSAALDGMNGYLFYLFLPPTGANNVVVSVGGDGNLQQAVGLSASYKGAVATRTALTDIDGVAAVSINLSDAQTGDLGIAVGGVYDNAALTYPSWANSETVRAQNLTGVSGDVGAAIAELNLGGGTTMGLNLSEDKHVIVGVALVPSRGGQIIAFL